MFRMYAGRKSTDTDTIEGFQDQMPTTHPIPPSIVRQMSDPVTPCCPPSKKLPTIREEWESFKNRMTPSTLTPSTPPTFAPSACCHPSSFSNKAK